VRNFELSSIVTLQSPRPFTMFVGFDANSDGNPVNDRVGESARDTYLGDPLRTVDLRLSRLIHVNERSQLQLSVDSFNLLNRANVDEVFTVYGFLNFVNPVTGQLLAVPIHYNDSVVDPFNPVLVSPLPMATPLQFQIPDNLAS